MLPDETNKSRGRWKPAALIAAAGAVLLAHVLACRESPMAFSPSGENLAFVTMEPYDSDNMMLQGAHVFRLFVLPTDEQPRIVEQTNQYMLTAPTYSPDGERLAYLRIPLLSAKQLEQLKAFAEKRKQQWDSIEEFDPPEWMPQAPATQPSRPGVKLVMPGLTKLQERFHESVLGPPLPCTLVFRDAKTFEELGVVPLGLQIIHYERLAAGEEDYFMSYSLARLQFHPDGNTLYLCADNTLRAVDLVEQKDELLACPAAVALLSPDGKVAAAMTGETIAFVHTDGSLAVYRRWERDMSPGGFAWADANTLVLLTHEDDKATLCSLRPDGSLAATKALDFQTKDFEEASAQLAIAPDGKYVAISYDEATFFLDSEGNVLHKWQGPDKVMLAQPTFAPEAKRVAFKLLSEDEQVGYPRVTEIVFFTPQGREISRVKVPPASPELLPASQPTTQPATQPATQPTE